MKFLAHIALFLATALMLGHDLTPHFHDKATESHVCAEEPSAPSLLHLISCFFHADLGQEHLEEFSGEKSLSLDVALVSAPISAEIAWDSKSAIGNRTLCLKGVHPGPPPALRGPPQA